jgi:hypothetical protein
MAKIRPSYIGRDGDGMYRRKLDEGMLKLTESYWRRARAYKKGSDAFETNRILLLKLMKKHRPSLGHLPIATVLLRYFLAERGWSQTDFCRVAGIRDGNYRITIKRWLEGTCPSLPTALIIEVVTEGLVPVEAWVIGGPELRAFGPSSAARRAMAARKVVATRLIKYWHLRHRAALVRMTLSWVNYVSKKAELDGIKAPEYRALREYGIATGAFAPHQRYRREDYEDPSTSKRAKDFRCLVDREGRAIPPGDYDARLEKHSLEAARKRQEWHEETWRRRDSNIAARRERLERSRGSGGRDGASVASEAAHQGDGGRTAGSSGPDGTEPVGR